MAMNLLQIVQEHARRQGLPVPPNVIANQSGYCQLVRGLLNEFCDDLDTRKYWQTNVREAQWTAVQAESQGNLNTLAPFGYQGIVPGTVFAHSLQRLLHGLSPQEWQARKVQTFAGPYVEFRLRGNEFLVNPLPAIDEVFSFEYYSSSYVYFPGIPGNTGQPPSYRQYWANDLDESVVSDVLAIAYLRWAYRRAKGLDYAEEFAKYERMVQTKSSRNDAPVEVHMDDCPLDTFRPGIIVPQFSWKVN